MAATVLDKSWMWHPSFSEAQTSTAGLFVHFRKHLQLEQVPKTLPIQITADTRYKLYVNKSLVAFGPVKGDANLWFYDEVDIASFLKPGVNVVSVIVLRFFYASPYASSFPRLPSGGLRISTTGHESTLGKSLHSGVSWEAAIDPWTTLRTDDPEDDFLHVYESVRRDKPSSFDWSPAILLELQQSTGHPSPWRLSPRMIPKMRRVKGSFSKVHIVQSDKNELEWTEFVTNRPLVCERNARHLLLEAGSSHCVHLEVHEHTTGFITVMSQRPSAGGATLKLKYAESYEDEPRLVPYLRQKGDRTDRTRGLYGPHDVYEYQGQSKAANLRHPEEDEEAESYTPFHFRTFRYVELSIEVGPSPLLLTSIEIEKVTYPLNVLAEVMAPSIDLPMEKLWTTSIRTLQNCMHDCYEDCPFYEQFQYAMDSRSSALFTYYLSGDDRMARQAIVQLRNSFQPQIGLTCSRAPSHNVQIIPHFSLFWICMVHDHWCFFGDQTLVSQCFAVIDAVLSYFHDRLDRKTGLISQDSRPGIWNFVDWVHEWQPYGIPPTTEGPGELSTYTNSLYAYALRKAGELVASIGRTGMRDEYMRRADAVVRAIREHCFDGCYFTDGLASSVNAACPGMSQHNQIWAVLCGAANGNLASSILETCLESEASDRQFSQTSISMSFYTLRALSAVGEGMYERHFHGFWDTWRTQLANNLTTWEEDVVSQRSDCHAWGSIPIFEFMAELAGIKPIAPGFSTISFTPLVRLCSDFEAKVPLGRKGIAGVRWRTLPSRQIEVRLTLDLFEGIESMSVHVTLPLQAMSVITIQSETIFIVDPESREE